jgi:hypothetical protein
MNSGGGGGGENEEEGREECFESHHMNWGDQGSIAPMYRT